MGEESGAEVKLYGIESTTIVGGPPNHNWIGPKWSASLWEEPSGWLWEFNAWPLYLATRKHYNGPYAAHAALARAVKRLGLRVGKGRRG